MIQERTEVSRAASAAVRFGNRLVWYVFALVALETLLSVPKLSLELAFGWLSPQTIIAIDLAVVLLVLVIIFKCHLWIAETLQRWSQTLARIRPKPWIVACILIGVALRVLWVSTFPSLLRSDGATYFSLARKLVEGLPYQDGSGKHAYWPPGYPFFLFPFFLAFGVHSWVPVLGNLLLFSATVPIVYRLAVEITDEQVGQFATLFLTIWPNYVMSAGWASKELVLVPLLPLAILLFIWALKSNGMGRSLIWGLLSGAVLGFAALTQPSTLLFPFLFLVYGFLRRERMSKTLMGFGLVLIGIYAVVSPWILRNHRVLHEWVAISTNSGDTFYRSNNPLATGGYVFRGEKDLSALDEVQRSKIGYQLGKEWIKTHPGEFLALALRKQILLLGDDARGVYETLKRGLEITDKRYFVLKALANLYWWIIWMLISAAVWKHHRSVLSVRPEIAMLMVSFVYIYLIHSIYESGARHHEPFMGLLAILAAMLSYRKDDAQVEV
jgi:4-amino-4-deoxy-L-arabinose transferase-like glycosyltransferase